MSILHYLQQWTSALLLVAAMPFFLAGMLGLLRFPDVFTRLHAVTKADNIGLGLVIAGLIIKNCSLVVTARLLLIWLLVMGASATAAYLVAAAARRQIEPGSTR
jgi:multicomponent Na+:H+ antiporter subunit G